MNDEPLHTLTQMQAFLDGTLTVEFSMVVEEGDGFIARTVRRFVVGDLGVVPYEPEGRVFESCRRAPSLASAP